MISLAHQLKWTQFTTSLGVSHNWSVGGLRTFPTWTLHRHLAAGVTWLNLTGRWREAMRKPTVFFTKWCEEAPIWKPKCYSCWAHVRFTITMYIFPEVWQKNAWIFFWQKLQEFLDCSNDWLSFPGQVFGFGMCPCEVDHSNSILLSTIIDALGPKFWSSRTGSCL